MTTICPKCRHVRQANETVPAWQCPACGVAYAKAADAARPSALPMTSQRTTSTASSAGIPWLKLIAIAAILWGAWSGYQISKNRSSGGAISSFAAQFKRLGADGVPHLIVRASTSRMALTRTSSSPCCARSRVDQAH